MTNPQLASTVQDLHKRAKSENKNAGTRSALARAESFFNNAVRKNDKGRLVKGLRAAREAEREAISAGEEEFANDINTQICQYMKFDQLSHVENMGRK